MSNGRLALFLPKRGGGLLRALVYIIHLFKAEKLQKWKIQSGKTKLE